ncbi:MAG: hypothetical protein H7Z71_07085 [Moraxellaceae bacterium]|nr:hypothetical protein [Pseudobdellovibrionaceae bacterium]
MQKLLQILLLTTGMHLSLNALAEIITVPRAANVRSSPNFFGTENVLDQLPVGAKVEVKSRATLSSGANALQIEILSPENKKNLNAKAPIYLWESKIEIQNNLFKTEAGVPCTDGTCSGNAATVAPSQIQDIKNIVNKTAEQQSEKWPLAEGTLADAVNAYSGSQQVSNTFEWAKSHKPWIAGNCYRHVKEALANQSKRGNGPGQNLISKWFSSSKAKFGVEDLKQKGFVNLLENESFKDMNSRTAPHGSVLIYKHINSKGLEDNKAGHAEIKFDDIVNGKKVSQFFYGPLRDYPVNNRNGSRYILIGVMIKSPIEESPVKK